MLTDAERGEARQPLLPPAPKPAFSTTAFGKALVWGCLVSGALIGAQAMELQGWMGMVILQYRAQLLQERTVMIPKGRFLQVQQKPVMDSTTTATDKSMRIPSMEASGIKIWMVMVLEMPPIHSIFVPIQQATPKTEAIVTTRALVRIQEPPRMKPTAVRA